MLAQVPSPVAAQATRVVHPLDAVGQELLQAAPTSAVLLQEGSAESAMWALAHVPSARSFCRHSPVQCFCKDAEQLPRPRCAQACRQGDSAALKMSGASGCRSCFWAGDIPCGHMASTP